MFKIIKEYLNTISVLSGMEAHVTLMTFTVLAQTPHLAISSKATLHMEAANAAFAVPLQVLVVDDRDGVQHHGTLQLQRCAPAAPGRPPSSADLSRLRPLMSALGDALATQEEGLDPDRLSRTYTALMAELQESAGIVVHTVELTPATLSPVLPKGEEGDEKRNAHLAELPEGEEEEEEGEEGVEKRNTQLAELPEGLRALAGEVRELAVRSTRLAVLPGWAGELTRLEALEVSGVEYEPNALLKSLPASLWQLGTLKQLTLAWLDGLEVVPDALFRLTSLGSLTIKWCGKLRALPRGISKLGALRELTLYGLNKLQQMPDLIGLTALDSLTIAHCVMLRELPRGLGKLGALKQLTFVRSDELQEMPDLIGLTTLDSLMMFAGRKLRALPRGLGKLGSLKQLTLVGLDELQEMPDLIGLGALQQLTLENLKLQEMPGLIGLTALDSLTIQCCAKLKTLPRGLGKLGSLKQLFLWGLDELQEMPDL